MPQRVSTSPIDPRHSSPCTSASAHSHILSSPDGALRCGVVCVYVGARPCCRERPSQGSCRPRSCPGWTSSGRATWCRQGSSCRQSSPPWTSPSGASSSASARLRGPRSGPSGGRRRSGAPRGGGAEEPLGPGLPPLRPLLRPLLQRGAPRSSRRARSSSARCVDGP